MTKFRQWIPLSFPPTLREEVAAREQEEGADGAGGGSRPGANTAEAQVTVPASSRQTRVSGSLQKQLEKKPHIAKVYEIS
jgi:hypothetical protein